MSGLSDCFRELQEEFDQTTGRTNIVKINGKPVLAVIEDVSFETIIANDGIGEAGGFRATVAIEGCPKFKQLDDIEARGMKVSILSFDNVNGVTWNIVAGDPTIE